MRTDKGSERGQAAVLAALCLMTLLVFVVMATNAGSLVSDRIRIQNVADASALAGAYAQAGRLNQIAQINSNIAYTAWYCRRRLTRTVGGKAKTWTQCLYEPLGGDLPFSPPFGPGVDGPGGGFRPPLCHLRGGSPRGPQVDPDAEALIDWCRLTMNGYRAQIAAVADWGTNYRRPSPSTPGGGVRRAATLTADTNFLKTGSEIDASRSTYLFENVDSGTDQAYSPTWRDDGRFLPDEVPRFILPVSPSGEADMPDLRHIPALVDLELAVTSFRYFVAYCDSAFSDPPTCTSLDMPRVINPSSSQGRSLYSWYGKRLWPAKGSADTLYSVYFPFKLFGTPAKRFFDLDDGRAGSRGYFGATSTGGSDQLAALSVAKPYGGHVGPNRLIGDSAFDANWGELPVRTTTPSLPVYGPASIRELIDKGFFADLGDPTGGGYAARLMGFGEGPASQPGATGLARPVGLVKEAHRLRRAPGRRDNLPDNSAWESVLLH